MHPSLVLLLLVSVILIILMVTCFVCFIRSRRKEDEELMGQVQFSNEQQQQQSQHHLHCQQQQYTDSQMQHMSNQLSPGRHQHLVQSPSNNLLITNDRQQAQPTRQSQLMSGPELATRNSYAVASGSPYHSPTSVLGPSSPRNDTRPDITQQINSAIIGSSEAEFQNDFIQVSLSSS